MRLLKMLGIGGVLTLGLLGLSNGADAALVSYADLGLADSVGLVYDSTQKITWTKNANLAATERFGIQITTGGYGSYGITADGLMIWNTAQAWIAGMNAANYGGYNDWRLWSALNDDGSDPCLGANCKESELGHLFYVDGGLTEDQSITSSAALTSVFTNLQNHPYWSGTEVASDLGYVWYFRTSDGIQYNRHENDQLYAWAVRDGDVTAVPLPAAVWLFGSGLAGLLAVPSWRRRRLGSLK
jgi:hypothetical protein